MTMPCTKEREIDRIEGEVSQIWGKVSKLNGGNVKWWQVATLTATLFGIIVTISLWGAKEVIAIDLRANGRYIDNRNVIMGMKEDISEVKTMLRYLIKNMDSVNETMRDARGV
jgi:hypothetical protein